MIFSLVGFINPSSDKDEYFNKYNKDDKESKYSLLNENKEISTQKKLMVKINI